MKERIAALLLVLVMAVSLPPVTAFAVDDAQDYELRVLTFEDADYKGGTNFAGGNDWSSLIDEPQYGGTMLYPNGSGTTEESEAYTWYDAGNTELKHTLPKSWDNYCYWGGGHAISHYVSSDFAAHGSFIDQLTVYSKTASADVATTGGGHNGSNNFAVHFGYKDNSGYTDSQILPSFAFADGVARVVDHMYVNNICYALNCYLNGNGLTAKLGGQTLVGGSLRFLSEQTDVSAETQRQAEDLARGGKTPLLFARDGVLLGMIAVADAIKPDSPRAVAQLREMGVHVVMLTGDNERTAQAIGAQAGVDEVIAGVLPGGKEETIRALQQRGPVAMVGDGVNDAPALTRADVGIAIGAGADVAIDAADVVLMKSTLADVPAAIRLSRSTLRNIRENLFWAFIYNIIGIPLAAGVFVPLGLTLNPMFGAAAMSLSSFCVVSNALRLNFCKLYGKDGPAQQAAQSEKEDGQTCTLRIKGMMCEHCENRVRTALEALPQITSAQVSHKAGTAIVTLNAPVDDETMKQAVEEQSYQVKAIKH